MKIIQYLPTLADGGAETLVKDYALFMKRQGHEVIIVVHWETPETSNYRILTRNNIKILSVYNSKSIINRIINKFFGRKLIPKKMRNIIISEKPDVIHVHMKVLRYIDSIKDILLKSKVFYTCHNLPKRYFGEGCEEEFQAAKALILKRKLQLIALHNGMKNELDNMFNITDTKVIKNGIDFSRFLLKDTKSDIRKELNIPQNAYVIGHVGRFVEQKNHEFIVGVFSELHKIKGNAFLLLVGTGPMENKIKKKIRMLGLGESCLFLSHRDDIPKIMKGMDVFFFPSLFEGFGNVITEAQLSGLRCVVSKNIPDEAYLSNLVVPIGLDEDKSIWIEALINKNMRSDYENKLKEYDMKNVIKDLEKLYQE